MRKVFLVLSMVCLNGLLLDVCRADSRTPPAAPKIAPMYPGGGIVSPAISSISLSSPKNSLNQTADISGLIDTLTEECLNGEISEVAQVACAALEEIAQSIE